MFFCLKVKAKKVRSFFWKSWKSRVTSLSLNFARGQTHLKRPFWASLNVKTYRKRSQRRAGSNFSIIRRQKRQIYSITTRIISIFIWKVDFSFSFESLRHFCGQRGSHESLKLGAEMKARDCERCGRRTWAAYWDTTLGDTTPGDTTQWKISSRQRTVSPRDRLN